MSGSISVVRGLLPITDDPAPRAGVLKQGGLLRQSKVNKRRAISRAIEPLESRHLLASTIYVDANSTGPAHNGSSWAAAYIDLQQALTAATAGDEIHVANGTYKPTSGTDRYATFQLKSGVSLLGGYAGFGVVNPDARDIAANPTILSGDIGAANNTSDNSLHVVTGSNTNATAVLDGFTVTGGSCIPSQVASEDSSGGGFFSINGSATIRTCTFTANSSVNGGAMYVRQGSPVVSECTFIGNATVGDYSFGAACYFGFYASATVTNCQFFQNSSSGYGGAITSYGSLVLRDCQFNNNTSQYYGGAVQNEGVGLTMVNCNFIGNSGRGGGALSNTNPYDNNSPTNHVEATNCIFANNIALFGGAIHDFGSQTTLTNCTLVGNSAPYGHGGAVYTYLGRGTAFQAINSILWNNSAMVGSTIYYYRTTVTIAHCDIQGGWAGAGNIDADPLLVDLDGADNIRGTPDDDVRLRASSPAVDAGNNTVSGLSGITTDASGGSRFLDVATTPDMGLGVAPIVDMGAYESSASGIEVEAGGPYRVIQGQSLTLTGQGSSDQSGPVTYRWDLDNDGQFDDAIGQTVLLSTAGLSGPQTLSVGLQYTDSIGRSVVDVTTVKVLPQVMYVDDSAVGSGNGADWANAYPNLQAALQDALAGNEIRIAQGTYSPTTGSDRTAAFMMKNGVTLIGGYAGVGAADPDARDSLAHPTILSGDIGNPGDTSDNSYHLLIAYDVGNTSILDGLTITAANDNPVFGRLGFDYGAGMVNDRSSAVIRNCTFKWNAANSGGGALNVVNGSNLTITNCEFLGNSAGTSGGGIYVNVSTVSCTNCVFVGNSAGSLGGAVYCNSSMATLTNCDIISNSAAQQGNGLAVAYAGSSVTITNSIVAMNDDIYDPINAVKVTYSDIMGWGGAPGNDFGQASFLRDPNQGLDNVWGTPDDDFGDLRLEPYSQCADAGNNAAVPAGVDTDLGGNSRFVDIPAKNDPGAIVDKGAYEAVITFYATGATFDSSVYGQVIKVTFNHDVNPASIDGGFVEYYEPHPSGQWGLKGGLRPIAYEADTRTLTFELQFSLSSRNCLVIFKGGHLSDTTGNRLSIDFVFEFFFLNGDANQDRRVDIADLQIIASNWEGDHKTFAQGDFSFNGSVDSDDLTVLAQNWQRYLPPPNLALPSSASMPTPAPRRTPVRAPSRVIKQIL